MSFTLNPTSARACSRLGQSGALFGLGLIQAIEHVGEVYLLTADMGKPAGMGRYKTRFPHRFVNVGIAEQNLLGMAAGLSSEGQPVVASAQAAFLSMRSFEPVRQYAGYMGWPLVLVGVSAGFGLTFFGNTHYALEDIALMRTIPGMTVLSPSDAGQAAKAVVAALQSQQPTYIRCTAGLNTPILYENDFEFVIGQAIERIDGGDITLFATGAVVQHAIQAARDLEPHGISAAVVDVHTIKPLDLACLKRHMHRRLWVSIEEHQVTGGLGSALAEQLALTDQHPPLLRLGAQDRFYTPGDYPYLISQAGLDAASIVQQVLAHPAVRARHAPSVVFTG